MKIKVEVLARDSRGSWKVVHTFVSNHNDATERRHLGFLCRYLFEQGMGVKTTPV